MSKTDTHVKSCYFTAIG